MKFSEKIIQARKAKALTQEDLAEAVGVSRQAVSKWETEEAKPDLDKLVAICRVLDLSMDYLCLDKQPEVTPEPLPVPAEQRNPRGICKGVAIGLVAALIMGVLAMGWNGWMKQPDASNATTQSTAPDYSSMLATITVTDAKCQSDGLRNWSISFVPSVQLPGMQVQIAIRNNKTGSTYYKDATKSGAGFGIDYPMPAYAFDYEFIAICSIGEVTVQFPLVKVESEDGSGFRTKYLWNE